MMSEKKMPRFQSAYQLEDHVLADISEPNIEYVATMLAQLSQISLRSRHQMLAYFIEMALLEARDIERRKKTD